VLEDRGGGPKGAILQRLKLIRRNSAEAAVCVRN
jgi:hypothetical protein